MVLSYTTSPAYHLEYEGTDRYRAAVFSEGHYLQIEGAGLVKGAPHRKEARAFLDFLLSPEAQGVLPLTNWKFPCRGYPPARILFRSPDSRAPTPPRSRGRAGQSPGVDR
jgi:thiamine transport system substrate-binding protein